MHTIHKAGLLPGAILQIYNINNVIYLSPALLFNFKKFNFWVSYG
jgi:hypothetical protein